jgi:hypothetical protein
MHNRARETQAQQDARKEAGRAKVRTPTAAVHPLSPRTGPQTDEETAATMSRRLFSRSKTRPPLRPVRYPTHRVMRWGDAQVEKYSRLSQAVLANHTAQRYDADSLALNAKLLELNPEVYSAWNFRKRCLGALLPTLAPADGVVALEKELQLVRALHCTALLGLVLLYGRTSKAVGIGGHGF